MSSDYSLVIEQDGVLRLHRPWCQEVTQARIKDLPILTMFDCAAEPPKETRRCECVREHP